MIPVIKMILWVLSAYWIAFDSIAVLIGICVLVFGDQYAGLFWVSLSLAVLSSASAFLMKDFKIQ